MIPRIRRGEKVVIGAPSGLPCRRASILVRAPARLVLSVDGQREAIDSADLHTIAGRNRLRRYCAPGLTMYGDLPRGTGYDCRDGQPDRPAHPLRAADGRALLGREGEAAQEQEDSREP